MKFLALVLGTVREMAAKATLYFLLGVSTAILLGVLLTVSSSVSTEGRTLVVFGKEASPPLAGDMFSDLVMKMEAGLTGGLFLGVVLFGVFATAGLIPDALEKGTVDLYLSKPIHRWELLLGKYTGGVVGIFAVILYFLASLWLILGIKLGAWNVNILLSSLLLTYIFASFYAVISYFGVLSRNSAIAILAGLLYLFVAAELLENRAHGLYLLSDNTIYHAVIDTCYWIAPQIPAMQATLLKSIAGGTLDWRPFGQSLLSSTALFGLAAWTLKNKDF